MQILFLFLEFIMKKMLIIAFLLTLTLLNSTIYVEGGYTGTGSGTSTDPWTTIQEGIDEALDGSHTGSVEILVRDYTSPYNEKLLIDLRTTFPINDLTLHSESGYANCKISYLNDIPIKVSGSDIDLIIEGFEITTSLSNTGILLEETESSNPVQINNCLITNNSIGIHCAGSNINISECIINYNTLGIFLQHNPDVPELIVEEDTNINYTEISNNDLGLSGVGDPIACYVFINNCTIVESTTALSDIDAVYEINNSILRSGSFEDEAGIVKYSNVETSDGTIHPGTGNFNQPARFTDSLNEDFTLMYDSPCIDSGDPNASPDTDGTRKDMGSYPVDQDLITDSRSLKTGWNWLCFPRLKRVDEVNNSINLPTFGTGKFIGSLWDNTVTGFNPVKITGNHGTLYWTLLGWFDYYNEIFSIEGYKLEMSGTATESQVGALESLNTEIVLTNLDTRLSYIGYIATEPGLITEVVPLDMLQYEFQIQAQNWCATYNPASLGGRAWKFDTSSEPVIKCGQMISLKMKDTLNGTFTFQWREPQTTRVEYADRPMPEYFSFVEQENYLPVFLELDSNNLPQEIALYIDGVCKGAAVVDQNQAEEAICQVNAYLLEEPEDNWQEELEIVYYDGARGSVETFNEFAVYNQHNSEFYNQNLILADMVDKDQITITMRDGNYEEAPETEFKFRSHNFPNPFNPTTDIHFSLPASADTSLEIYNVKGQKVRTLISGKLEQGEHQITWDGTDSNRNSMSSGIYFYRLQSGNNAINKKIMLLK